MNEHNKQVAGMFTWTALTRRDKLNVLTALQPKLAEVFAAMDAQKISSLWKV